MFYKPRARLQLTIPVADDSPTQPGSGPTVTFEPDIVALKWTKNHHLAADILTVTISWMEGGVDPRLVKNARCRMFMWDDAFETFDEELHERFVGIGKTIARKLASNGWVVDMTFHDYTSFFLMMKPFPTDGLPEYSDTLAQAWQKICDYTGYRDSGTKKIVSNVGALKNALKFDPPELASRTIGESVSKRFHAVAKPPIKTRSDAWGTWTQLLAAIGLVSYIDRTEVIVTTTVEHYTETTAPKLLYGRNILDFEESVDAHVSQKGILGKAFDPLKGVLLESAYPSPDDPRIKKSRAQAKKVASGDDGAALNATSADYEEQYFPNITEQATLDEAVKNAFEEFSRQEMKGKITTAEMRLPKTHTEQVSAEEVDDPTAPIPPVQFRSQNDTVDVLGFRPGDCIHVGMDDRARDLLKFQMSLPERITYLMEVCGYGRPIAELVARNIDKKAFKSPIFHVETLEVEFGDNKFMIHIGYHNKISI